MDEIWWKQAQYHNSDLLPLPEFSITIKLPGLTLEFMLVDEMWRKWTQEET